VDWKYKTTTFNFKKLILKYNFTVHSHINFQGNSAISINYILKATTRQMESQICVK